MLTSLVCRYGHFESNWYARWANLMGFPAGVTLEVPFSYRQIWDWCTILQALAERDMLRAGRRGIGFAVGNQPLPSVFAAHGAGVLVTDRAVEEPAAFLDTLLDRQICDEETFRRRVNFRPVDMNDLSSLPDWQFDFVWSAAAMQTIGGLDQGIAFVRDAMRMLRPGGVAVHTTLYNVSSDTATLSEGGTILYRKQDLERLGFALRPLRCGLEPLDLDAGLHRFDLDYDEPPYFSTERRHIKFMMEGHVTTSVLLIAQKAD